MKKKRIFLVILLIYFVVFWKIPFYILLLSVHLPENAILLKRQVSYSDVYNPHILAEIVFASDQGYGNIEETNRMIMRKNHFMRCKIMDKWELMEWDDRCILVYKMDELAAEAGKQTWYYVSFNMPVPTLIMLRILEIILIFVAIHFVSGIKRKTN